MENFQVTTTVVEGGIPVTTTAVPTTTFPATTLPTTTGFETGNVQLTSGDAVFQTATPAITTPVVPLTAPIVEPIVPMVAAPTVVTTVLPAVQAPLPPPPIDTNLKPIEKPENKEKLVSKPPVARAAPTYVPPVAPVLTDFTTPARHHNTTAHVADVAHDPRPLLKVDNEVHDFEVHREGAYAKGHTFPHAGVHKTNDPNRALPGAHAGQAVMNDASSRHGTTVAPAGPGLYGPTGYAAPIGPGTGTGARPLVHREGLVGTEVVGAVPGAALVNDPRPPLPLEREVHDFEVHRQGAHAAGHTRPGAKPEGTYVGAVPATVEVKGNTTNVRAAPVTNPAAAPYGSLPSTRI